MKIKHLILIILLLTSYISIAQLYDNDQAHSNLKWRQINTPNFTLIFPLAFEKTAHTLASQMDELIARASQDLQIKPKKISIVLQSNHLNPNGYVQLAPRKSEFNTTPPSVADNTSWLTNLALHEMRHVAQFDKLTGRLKAPFLEILALGLFGLNLPSWFFEGDAVYVETVNSDGGRGRLPSWNMPLRTNLISNKNYTFDKYLMGSFKDLIPSFYTIGYFLNTQLENMQNPSLKNDILEDMRHHLLRPYNFNKALKKHTGYKSTALYLATIDTLKQLWKEPFKTQNPQYLSTTHTKYPTSYLLPQRNKDHELIALQQAPNKTPQLVKINHDKTERIIYTGQQINHYFDLKGDYLIWDEYRRDARFAKQTYQIINVYNYKTKKLKEISKNSRYYTPIMHPNLHQVATVHVDMDNRFSLHFIDVESKQVIDSIKMPGLTQLTQPQYNAKGDKIVAIAIDERGVNLVEIDLSTKMLAFLLPWQNQQYERPLYANDNIVFKAHFEGKDQIYKLNMLDKRISKITSEQFGAFNPTMTSRNEILYNAYQYDGYHIAQTPLDTSIATDVFLSNFNNQLNTVHNQPYNRDTPTKYESKSYSPLSGFFNFHSLTISNSNFESFDNYRPGLFWQANDLLNTSQLKMGYEYDLEKQKSIYSAEVLYQKYYPKIKIKYENKGEIGQAGISGVPDSVINFDWRQHGIYADINLPFTIYRRNHILSYGINFGTSYVKRYQMSLPQLRNFNSEIAFPLNYQVYFNRNSLRARMDLAPRWGQNLNIIYRHLPFENQLNGNILSVLSNFYFPGILSNHSLQLRMAYQESTGQYQYSYDIPLVSGFGYFNSPKIKNTMMLNYRFPIAYPDWAVGSFAYLKRIQGLLFSDYQNVEDSKFAPKSIGVGVSADVNFFRYVLPEFNIGTRMIYVNDASASQKIIPTFSFSYSY